LFVLEAAVEEILRKNGKFRGVGWAEDENESEVLLGRLMILIVGTRVGGGMWRHFEVLEARDNKAKSRSGLASSRVE
jgi:hypothetical protein